ncbi:MAG: glycosyltransferase 87 family protein [Armatimonadota bacterium]
MSLAAAVPRVRLRPELWIWLAAGLVHLFFWLSLRTGWMVPLFNDSVHRFGPGADFFALYQAGYSALHGDSIFRFGPGETVIPYAYPFRYLPVAAYTIGALLSLVPPTAAYVLWLTICEACLLHNVRLTYRRSGGGLRGAVLGAVWLGFTPYFLELWIGQFTFLLGSLLFWSVLALEEGRSRTGLGWWIASVLWKPASLLWAPLFARDRRGWMGLAVCGALILLNGVYFLFFPHDWALFVRVNVDPLPQWHAGNIGLSGLIYQFTGPGPLFKPVRGLLTALLLLPALWVTLRPVVLRLRARCAGAAGRASKELPGEAPVWLLAALWTCLYFLIYKDVWEHHLTLLLPILVLGLWRSPSRLLIAVVVLLALPSPFVFYDVPDLGFNQDPQYHFSSAVSLLHHSWRVVPLAALYAVWLRQSWRGPAVASTTTA